MWSRTLDSEYFEVLLTDVLGDIHIVEDDCEALDGIEKTTAQWSARPIVSLADRLVNRVLLEDVRDATERSIVIAKAQTRIDRRLAERFDEMGVERVRVRSPLTCQSRRGVCAQCYGPGSGRDVGVNAARQISYPPRGQPPDLKMKFEIGSSVGQRPANYSKSRDTLPLVDPTNETSEAEHRQPSGSILEPHACETASGLGLLALVLAARRPVDAAVIAEIDGTVSVALREGRLSIDVVPEVGGEQRLDLVRSYRIEPTRHLRVSDGWKVRAGERLTVGDIDSNQVLHILGQTALAGWVLDEVLAEVYALEGVRFDELAMELLLSEMLGFVKVREVNDSSLRPGEIVRIARFQEQHKEIIDRGGAPPAAEPVLLGLSELSALKKRSIMVSLPDDRDAY